MRMDIVYILGKGSIWNNNEIRYSLRSVEKHLKGYDKIFVVGENPGIENITHIPATDPYPMNKEKNIFHKILVACEDERISDDFLFMNDDHFFLQDFNINEMPNYRNGTITEYLKRRRTTTYTISTYNTKKALDRAGLADIYFDVHTPIIYNKAKFQQLKRFDFNVKCGLIIKSLYGNLHILPGTQLSDCKLQKPVNESAIKEMIRCRPFFSIGDGALHTSLKNVMEELYPEKIFITN